MAYRYVDADEIELEYESLRPVRKALGLESFGVNELTLAPDSTNYPEHDELTTSQDEVFVVLEGDGTMTVDGESIELVPGRYVLVTPESRRCIRPGSKGARLVVIGAPAEGKHGGRF